MKKRGNFKKNAIPMIRYLLICFHLFTIGVSSQITLTRNDIKIDTHAMNEVGQELIITKSDETLLEPNSYICNYNDKDKVYPISFLINNAGKPDGVVACKDFFKVSVHNGIIERYEKYYSNGQLSEEGFKRGDTIVNKYFTRHGEIRSEYRDYHKINIYNFNCSYSEETDRLGTCILKDDVKGIYIHFREGGKMESRTLSKNLSEGVRKQSEYYDEKNRLTHREFNYDHGKTKTVYADGSYTITTETEGGLSTEEYTKSGKLIRKYKATYPSISAPK